MCMMCDGASLDEVLAVLDEQIDDHGYAIVPVEGTEGRPSWAYTIGLVERFDHPELVITQTKLHAAVLELDMLVELIEGGQRLDDVDSIELPSLLGLHDDRFDLVDVHPSHLERGLMNMWVAYYSRLGRGTTPWLRARQAYTDAGRCEHHVGKHLLLDTAADVLCLTPPNRAERRARDRQQRRKHRRGPHR